MVDNNVELDRASSADPSNADNGHESRSAPTIGEVAAQLLAARRDVVLERLEDGADLRGKDQAEVVHQLRVSSRRADAALEFLSPWLPAKKSERLRKRLKKLRQAAGRVRDCDVIQSLIGAAPRQQRHELRDRLKQRRKASRRKLAGVIAELRQNPSLARLWKRLLNHLEPAAHAAPFLPWAHEQLGLWLAEFTRDAPTALDTLPHMHAFRIAGKRLRYALELLPPHAHSESVASLMALLKNLQEQLGQLCDQEALHKRLLRWSQDAHGKTSERLAVDAAAAEEKVVALLVSLRGQWAEITAKLKAIEY